MWVYETIIKGLSAVLVKQSETLKRKPINLETLERIWLVSLSPKNRKAIDAQNY